MQSAIEVDIRQGRVIPLVHNKVPRQGRALLIMLNTPARSLRWSNVRKHLGWLKPKIGPATWQRQQRDEWT